MDQSLGRLARIFSQWTNHSGVRRLASIFSRWTNHSGVRKRRVELTDAISSIREMPQCRWSQSIGTVNKQENTYITRVANIHRNRRVGLAFGSKGESKGAGRQQGATAGGNDGGSGGGK
eukprot:1006632-Pyramimonas_sp.AAC.1